MKKLNKDARAAIHLRLRWWRYWYARKLYCWLRDWVDAEGRALVRVEFARRENGSSEEE